MPARGPNDATSLYFRSLLFGEEGLDDCGARAVPDAVRHFYRRLRKRFCRSWSTAACALVMRDAHRWVLLDGPMPVNGRQIADFHAYQLQCDLLLDRMEEEEAVAELEFRIASDACGRNSHFNGGGATGNISMSSFTTTCALNANPLSLANSGISTL